MGREGPSVITVCWLLAFCGCVLLRVSANISLPPGLIAPGKPRNNTLLTKIYLTILKEKITKEIAKVRGNVTDAPTPRQNNVKEHRDEPDRQEPQFVIAHSPGKNLLKFTMPKTETNEAEVTSVNLWIHVWQKEKKNKNKKQLRRKKKGKLIRIRVYNNSSQDEGVIAELQTRINSTSWYRISLPISLIQNMEKSNNHTVVLRLECKRCNRRTQLMLQQNVKKKCRKNRRKRKRKNRKRKPKALKSRKRGCVSKNASARLPFMVIDQKYRGSGRRIGRQKRSLNCDPEDLAIVNGTLNSSRCCRLSSYVEFSDLELDDAIVTPAGYEASRCVGRCPRVRRRSPRRGRNRNGGRDRKWKRGRCRAVNTAPLTVWLFNSNHDLVQAHLPGLVVRNCDCR